MINYAYCIVEWKSTKSWRIIGWSVVNTYIKKTCGVVKISDKMEEVLRNILSVVTLPINVIIVEAQPGRRLIMERILCTTINYLKYVYSPYIVNTHGIKPKVCIRRSQDKFSVLKEINKYPKWLKGRKNYCKRKEMAVLIGYICLQDKRNKYDHSTYP